MNLFKVNTKTNDANYMKQVSFVVALSVILYDGDLDEPDSNLLCHICFADLKSQSLAGHQVVIIASGSHKAPVMHSVAGAPAFIQFEGEDKLPRVDRFARFGETWLI